MDDGRTRPPLEEPLQSPPQPALGAPASKRHPFCPRRIRVAVALVILLFACAGAMGIAGVRAAPARAFEPGEPLTWAQQPLVASDPRRLMESSGDGSSPFYWPISPEEADYQALSPDGQQIAISEGHDIFVVKRGGTPNRIYTATSGTVVHEPRWSSDGQRLIFAENGDIKTMAADGTNVRTVIGWRGWQVGGDFSPDGSRITFVSFTDSKGKALPGGSHVFTANASDGTSHVQITRQSSTMAGADDPVFSPDGTKIAFSGGALPDGCTDCQTGPPQIFTVRTGGTGMTRLTFDGSSTGGAINHDTHPAWTPDGSFIVFRSTRSQSPSLLSVTTIWEVAPSGLGLKPLFVSNPWPEAPTYVPSISSPTPRRHSSKYGLNDYLAHGFRPHLRFDDAESYRPLDADMFIAERNDQGAPLHQVCRETSFPPTCQPLSVASDLYYGSVLDIAGEGDAGNYHSPYGTCTTTGIRDCDTGPRSGIYYWVTPEDQGATPHTTYFDYWFFYRYNDWPGLVGGDHEGDWESVTLGQSQLNPRRFAFASFSQHGHWYSYLRENLRCDGGGPGSCGSTSNPLAGRLDVFVAKGSHANYPAPCDPGGLDPTPCDVRTDQPISEAPHDGTALWGNDSLSSALLALEDPSKLRDPANPLNNGWASWTGDWGSPSDAGPNGPGHGPNGPHFFQPWKSECARDNPGCPTEFEGASASTRRRSSATRGNDRCGAWFGGGVVAVVCDRPRLRASVARRWRSRPGTTSLWLPRRSRQGRQATSGSAPGVAQAMSTPLRPGQMIRVRARAAARVEILVRARAAQNLVEARFMNVRVRPGSGVRIVARRRLRRPVLRLVRADGSEVSPTDVRRMSTRRSGRRRSP